MQPPNTHKRRYTVTAKVLAANRANLLKANAVDKSIRYRPTRRRLAACRANLLKAQAALRAAGDRSPAYGVCFRHGLYAVSLRRSARLAGEDPAEFDTHLDLFLRAFAPHGAFERKLVRGLAETAWRRLRVFGGQANWERLSLAYRLREACQVIVVQPDDSPPPELDPINRHHALAGEVLGIFLNDVASSDSLGKLHERFERLGRLLVERRSPHVPPLVFLTTPRPSDRELARGPQAALGNPFRSARFVAQALKPKPLALGRFAGWGWGEKAGERRPLRPFWNDLAGLGEALRYGLVRRLSAQPAPAAETAGVAASDASEASDFASWARLFEAAFDSAPAEIRVVAELVWQRLGVYARQAQQEAEALRRVLEQAAAARPGHLPRQRLNALATRQLIARLLEVFLKDLVAVAAAFDLLRRLRAALYLLLTKRYGLRRRFEGLKPRPRPAADKEASLGRLLHALSLLPLGSTASLGSTAPISIRTDRDRGTSSPRPPPG